MSKPKRCGRRSACHLLPRTTVLAGLLGVSSVLTGCIGIPTTLPEDYVGPKPRPTVHPPAPGGVVVKPVPTTSTLPVLPPPAPSPASTSGTVPLSIEEAALSSLEHNQAFKVQRLNVAIRRTAESVQRAAFDPTVTGSLSYSKSRTAQKQPGPTGGTVTVRSETNRTQGTVGISEFLPTGTTIDVSASGQRTESDPGLEADTASGEISITQALLRGGSLQANLASLRQAELSTKISQYELRAVAETQVAQVEETCWDYILAQRSIKLYEDSLVLAKRQLEEIRERITVGTLAGSELAAAQAEVAIREEGLINARSTLDTTRIRLLRLVNPPNVSYSGRDLTILDDVGVPEKVVGNVEDHVKLAKQMRPDLNQARLQLQSGELDVVRTRNGLLPRLDAFITLGGTGYSDSFGRAVRAEDGNTKDMLVGMNFEYPLLNRAPQANHARATLSLDQQQEALLNTAQLVEVDVRTACIEVARAREQITATAATARAQEETLRAETGKHQEGKSTSWLVARAQRDLLSAQLDEVRTVIAHLKAIVELYRLEGSLLERRGIEAPGRKPVNEIALTPMKP